MPERESTAGIALCERRELGIRLKIYREGGSNWQICGRDIDAEFEDVVIGTRRGLAKKSSGNGGRAVREKLQVRTASKGLHRGHTFAVAAEF